MIRYFYTPHSNFDDIVRDLDEIRLDFEPQFYFLFLTKSTLKICKGILKFLRKRYPCKMVGFTVEGFVTEDGVWTRGLAILFFEKGVEVFWTKGENTERTFKRLREKVGSGWDSAIVVFPLFRFGSRLSILRFILANNTIWYHKYRRARCVDDRISILRDYSKVLESKYIFPPNKALRFFGEFPVVGFNLMPLQAGLKTPVMIVDYRMVGRSAVAVCFKGKINTRFHDVFPERGRSFDETFEIIKGYFPSSVEVNVVKGGIAVGEINGVLPVKFLENSKYIRIYSEDETLRMIEREKFRTVSPYGLALISNETFGSSILGLGPVPLKIYPCLFDLDLFYDRAMFLGEHFRGGIRAFRGLFEGKSFEDSFDFFVIDSNVIPMFAGRCVEIKRMAEDFCRDYFGVFSAYPSFKFNILNKNYFSEIQRGLCFMTSGTSAMLEIRDLEL